VLSMQSKEAKNEKAELEFYAKYVSIVTM